MYKKIRKYWWLLSNLVKKDYPFVLLGIFLTFIISFGIWSLLNQNILGKTKKIGIVANYTQKTIPEEVTRLISRGLTKQNESGAYEIDLAESIAIKNDGKMYVVKLKPGVRFQNGKEFTTKDINYNFKDVTFVAKNKYEGYFLLKEKYAPFLKLLSIPITDDKLNGMGEYKVEKIEYDGEFIKTIALRGPEKIIYRFYPNPEIARTAFSLGEINILKHLNSLSGIKIWKKVSVKKESDESRFVAIFFSFKGNAPVTEKTLRQALAYSINRKNFTEKPAYSPYSFSSSFYNENVKKYYYDKEAATTLFEKFQGDSKKKIAFTLYANPEYEGYAKKIAAGWNSILKTNVSVKTTTNVPYQWQVYMTTSEIPKDPDQYSLWHSNMTFRFSNYRNLKVDKLLEDGRVEIDEKKRKEIYAEVQKTLTEDLPAIFLFYPNSYTISY